jgi:hypothetical protein
MKKNIVKYLIIFSCAVFLSILIFYISNYEEPTFNQVELNEENTIHNFTNTSYYDTIIHLGLNELQIKNISVVINRIHENARKDFELQGGGILGAHLKELNNNFYLYLDEFDKSMTIDVISHELIHLEQYYSKRLKYENDSLTWNGERFGRTELQYENRPWEIEAYRKEKELSKKIKNILYEKK